MSPSVVVSTLMSAVFGSTLSLLFLLKKGEGGLVCESLGKAQLLSAHFDSKQSMDPLDLPPPNPITVDFKSR